MSTNSKQSIKNILALFVASTTLAVTSTAIPALAYGSNEHSFEHNERIKSMTQEEGNGYCRNRFQQLKATGDLGGGFDANRVNHVWAHIQNGDCIANT
jgi:hypothetical protein